MGASESSPSNIRSTRSAVAGPEGFHCSTTSAPIRATTWAKSSTSSRRTRKFSTIYWGSSDGLVDGWARRLSVGLTYEDHAFEAVPDALAAPALLPSDRTLVYPWIGAEWVQDSFRTARNRDQIEKTEDYSLGWHARAQLGYASTSYGSDRNAVMLVGNLSKGLEMTERQSLFFGLDASGRVEEGAVAGGLFSAAARYYFRQSPRRVLFLNLSATAGTNLDADQQILLGGDNGLRGYPLRYQSGEGRWLFTAEQRLFSNWYPFQMFNVGGACSTTWAPPGARTRSARRRRVCSRTWASVCASATAVRRSATSCTSTWPIHSTGMPPRGMCSSSSKRRRASDEFHESTPAA
jgi:hypothetical protein